MQCKFRLVMSNANFSLREAMQISADVRSNTCNLKDRKKILYWLFFQAILCLFDLPLKMKSLSILQCGIYAMRQIIFVILPHIVSPHTLRKP